MGNWFSPGRFFLQQTLELTCSHPERKREKKTNLPSTHSKRVSSSSTATKCGLKLLLHIVMRNCAKISKALIKLSYDLSSFLLTMCKISARKSEEELTEALGRSTRPRACFPSNPKWIPVPRSPQEWPPRGNKQRNTRSSCIPVSPPPHHHHPSTFDLK